MVYRRPHNSKFGRGARRKLKLPTDGWDFERASYRSFTFSKYRGYEVVYGASIINSGDPEAYRDFAGAILSQFLF